MPTPSQIAVAQLARLIGLPGAPVIVDVRTQAEHEVDPRVIPAARRHDAIEAAQWRSLYAG